MTKLDFELKNSNLNFILTKEDAENLRKLYSLGYLENISANVFIAFKLKQACQEIDKLNERIQELEKRLLP